MLPVLFGALTAHAATPTLTHQGRLVDSLGAPENGGHTLRVELFDQATGGTSLHQEDLPVTLSDGYYAVVLGANGANPLDVADFAGDVWLELTIDPPASPLGPRERLTDTPRAVQASDGLLPAGTVIASASTTTPSGWLPCDGAAVSRTTYASLFTAIGTTFGAGNGSTTFNVPDLRGRVAAGTGQGTGLTNRTLGQAWGEEAHAQTAAEVGVHTHTVGASNGTGLAVTGGGTDDPTRYGFPDNTQSTAVVMYAHGNSGGTPFNVTQPTLALRYLIKY